MRRRSEASTSSGGGGGISDGETVVMDCGRRKSSCGYCKSAGRSSISHGLWAQSIAVDDYQDLLDRGWRRSGCFLYKPEMEKTCCPSYTIRLKASEFVPTKEQLRVSKRMQRFLDGTLEIKKSTDAAENSSVSCTPLGNSNLSTKGSSLPGEGEENNREQHIISNLLDHVDKAIRSCTEKGELPSDIQFPKASVKKVAQARRKLLAEGPEDLLYSSNSAFQVAAVVRRLQATEKDTKRSADDCGLCAKIIAEKLVTSLNSQGENSGLRIRACNGHINFYAAALQDSTDEATELVVSDKSATGCKTKGFCPEKSSKNPAEKKQQLEIRLKQSSFDPEEFALYRRYQIQVHDDKPDQVTDSSYKRFLVDTPLIFVPPSGDRKVPPCGFGSFHQQYLIDGRLVAVGVIDVLPKCLSSKYLFWDPDFAFLSLGKYSARQEISWVKENQTHCRSLQYYYLGYYIHSCVKMRYKAAYHPSELLCPLRYQWVPCDIARPLLDRKQYVVLSDYAHLQNGESLLPHVNKDCTEAEDNDKDNNCNDVPMDDGEESSELESESSDYESVEMESGDIGNILVGLKGSRLRFLVLQQVLGLKERSILEPQLLRYQSVVGPELSKRMVLSLS